MNTIINNTQHFVLIENDSQIIWGVFDDIWRARSFKNTLEHETGLIDSYTIRTAYFNPKFKY